ncbi:MAG TPA: tetratricopeptide repeat protein, partial [Anaerolineales bacterium]|nr:tetratricopeptide repeat protein [Anaerolineales bacterium]
MAKLHLRAYNREIESMLDGGLFQEAVGHSLHILKTHPKHLETYRLLGKGYLELKQYSDAIDIFTRLLACVPNDFVANVGMGIIRDEENKVDEAIWHMERAFETQPSNPAIQSELQRLYTRRDGSAPPRIRMTRGALAQMYLQGELYPQAISEIKAVLTEDPGRTDMQVLLTRAHFRSGQKTEAAEVANSLLRRYPYCLEANRVLAEIFSVDRPENAGPYRLRVFELDPYAAHVTGSLSQSADAPESAIALEKLDWNGQPVGMPSDWRETRGISLPSETRDEKPAWLQSGYDKEDTVPPTPFVVPASPGAVPASRPDDNIPDFMRKAGWGESSSAFDESKSPFTEDESQPPAIAAGDLPDWVKDMAPAEAEAPAGEKEDVPDWMNRIDPGILGTTDESSQSPADQPDWLKGIGEPSYNAPTEQPASDEPEWLKGAGEPSYNAPLESSAGDQPDWLKDLGESESTAQPASDDQPDWLNQEAGETEKQETPAFDFSAPQAEIPSQSPAKMENQPASEKDLDDSFAWLESLAAKQGATEGLLMKPEERLEQEPDWVRQAKSLTGELEQPAMTPPPAEEEAPLFVESQAQPSADLESLGKTEQEQDDSFAWLENLAAKQGATEGLLTKPEDRLQQEPDWVTQAKEIGEEQKPPGVMEQPSAEGMDTAMWLRSLDQGETSEVPATEPAADETAMWLKGLDEESKPEPAMESAIEDTSIWLKGLDETEARSEPVSESADETAMWLKGLDEESKPEPAMESTSDDTSMWLKGLDETEVKPEPVSESADETARWLKGL